MWSAPATSGTVLSALMAWLASTNRLGNLRNVAQVGSTTTAKDVYPWHACRERPILVGEFVGIAGVKLHRGVEFGVAFARGVGAQAPYPPCPVSVFQGRRKTIGMSAVDHVV